MAEEGTLYSHPPAAACEACRWGFVGNWGHSCKVALRGSDIQAARLAAFVLAVKELAAMVLAVSVLAASNETGHKICLRGLVLVAICRNLIEKRETFSSLIFANYHNIK